MFTKKFFASVLLAVVCASSALAAPWSADVKHATHRLRIVGRELKLDTYHPPTNVYEVRRALEDEASVFWRAYDQTYGEGKEHGLTKRADATVEASAASFLGERLGLKADDFHVRSKSQGDHATHVFLRQTYKGVPFANAVANIAFGPNNKVLAFGSSFVKPSAFSFFSDVFPSIWRSNLRFTEKFASSKPTVDINTAIKAAEETLGGKFNNHTPTLEYLARDDDTASLTHVVQIQDDDKGIWLEAFVDAHSGDVISVTDFVAQATVCSFLRQTFGLLLTVTSTVPRAPDHQGGLDPGLWEPHRPSGHRCIPERLAQRWYHHHDHHRR
jgi:extracellular elastinolytic metalloproteinase